MRDSEDFIIFGFLVTRLNLKSMFHTWNTWPVENSSGIKKNVLSFRNYREKAYNFIEVFLVKDKSKHDTCLWRWKKHLAWRLMIQFTATRTKNNANRRFYSTEDKNYTIIIQKYLGDYYWRIFRSMYQIVSWACNVIRYVGLTTHKFKLGLGHRTHTVYT